MSGFVQTASWLCGALAAMEDIVQPLSDPVELRDVLQHFKTKRHKNRTGKPLVETLVHFTAGYLITLYSKSASGV